MSIAENSLLEIVGEPYSHGWADSSRALLGDSLARELGIFAVPADVTLSIVIPVFNLLWLMKGSKISIQALPSAVVRILPR